MLVGHTRCFVDGNFGLLKRFYGRSDIDTVQQLQEMTNNSSQNNVAQMYPWEWRAWDKMLDGLFKPVKGIRRYQHFTFCDSQKGNVSVKSTCDGEENTVSILKKGVTVKEVEEAQLPQIIQPGGMTREQRQSHMSSVGIASHGLSVKCHEYCLQTTAIPGLSL